MGNLKLLFDRQMLAETPTNEAISMDAEQIFPLIDSILPFEVCLHYQVLPLSLTDDCLHLGIVDPDDNSALEYVNKMLAYRNCSLVTKKISFPEQQAILSAYLYHTQHQNSDGNTEKPISTNGVKVNKNSASNPNKICQTCSCQNSNLPSLEIYGHYLNEPIEILATLTPEKLLPELLGRVMAGGIGRLYFERQGPLRVEFCGVKMEF